MIDVKCVENNYNENTELASYVRHWVLREKSANRHWNRKILLEDVLLYVIYLSVFLLR